MKLSGCFPDFQSINLPQRNLRIQQLPVQLRRRHFEKSIRRMQIIEPRFQLFPGQNKGHTVMHIPHGLIGRSRQDAVARDSSPDVVNPRHIERGRTGHGKLILSLVPIILVKAVCRNHAMARFDAFREGRLFRCRFDSCVNDQRF